MLPVLVMLPEIFMSRVKYKQAVQWLIVLLLPYVLIGIFSSGSGFLLLPLGGTLGIFTGITSSSPYITPIFRISLIVLSLALLALFFVGFRSRKKLWGKALCSCAIYLWCIAGSAGFG